jgi:hypothetical protein
MQSAKSTKETPELPTSPIAQAVRQCCQSADQLLTLIEATAQVARRLFSEVEPTISTSGGRPANPAFLFRRTSHAQQIKELGHEVIVADVSGAASDFTQLAAESVRVRS